MCTADQQLPYFSTAKVHLIQWIDLDLQSNSNTGVYRPSPVRVHGELSDSFSTGRIDWLSDLSSFDTVKLFWSRVHLRHIDHTTVQNPHVNAGQSGCFLPPGPDGEPGVFLLFGGISPVSGACVEDLCIISPDRGRWFTAKPVTCGVGWPAGRCGHSVCALDSNRALVMFGNLESFMAPSFDMAAPKPYRGRPAGDMWILTRYKQSESSQG
ncbi:uncharacterized protein DEA37_0012576 [Paragonimus westermani]|uniref:Rab9 effector protein with kelch motifs n=1 Tax=Paragonimus westermani TaxID=34504 RepID=A0A5J4NIC4_9TREM|nr:uncharacterized protein DEA37_0012576 [Paragonimus westermani]